MGKCQALYRGREGHILASVSFSDEVLSVFSAERAVLFYVPGAQMHGMDAMCEGRFVRQLTLWNSQERLVLISSPLEGSIAPRAARLPIANLQATVLPRAQLLQLEQWLGWRRRINACSLIQLVHFAEFAEEGYAGMLGELYARRVQELSELSGDPLRGPLEVSSLFSFLKVAAGKSVGCRIALLAAYASFMGGGHNSFLPKLT